MTIQYDKKTDVLTISFASKRYECFDLDAEDFTVTIDETNELIEITIDNASQFIGQAIAAGVKVEHLPTKPQKKSGMVWYDVESSMISAFGYDESEKVLEVAFNRTGVYRYYDVPVDIFEGLRDASSKGSYMRSMIIDMYPYEKKRGRSR